MVFTVTLIATLYLLLVVTDAVINRTLSAESPGGRKLARQLGIEPRRLGLIGKLTSGIVRALFVLIVLALAVGRWEVAAADLFEAVKGVAFGIRIGDFTISFGAVFGAIAFFLVIVVLTRLMQRWLEKEVMPHTAIEPSLQLSIVTILGYVGFIIAIVLALGELGIDPQKIALVAGALSVGIGFGLQSIVSNFVSGPDPARRAADPRRRPDRREGRRRIRAPHQRARDRDRDLRQGERHHPELRADHRRGEELDPRQHARRGSTSSSRSATGRTPSR